MVTRKQAALLMALAAVAGPRARAEADPGVTYLPAAQVAAAFAKGQPLLETDRYKVHASRREAAGQAEVHARDTDVFYVVSGSATFVTGGRVLAWDPTRSAAAASRMAAPRRCRPAMSS
jgi:mannose-6-phosphate isomerase-like protein (cupin superfamily)